MLALRLASWTLQDAGQSRTFLTLKESVIMPKLRTPAANTPTVAVEQMEALAYTLELLDIDPALLAPARDALVKFVEDLPVDYSGTKKEGVKFYVLQAGVWRPAHKGTEETNKDDPLCGFLRYETYLDNGERTGGLARRHEWCKADSSGLLPDYHWLEPAAA